MKKIIVFLFALLLIPGVVQIVDASSYQNYYGIVMTEEEYNNLEQLGFDELEIYYMSEDEFNYNKDIEGNLEATSTRYFAHIIRYDATGRIISSSDMEITEEDYNSEVVMPIGDVYVETTYKRLKTVIAASGSRYRYKVTLTWKLMPAVRSHDIIGIGCVSSRVYIDATSPRFSQTSCIGTSCTNTTTYVGSYIGTNGAGVSFKLPSSTSITTLHSFYYYDVNKESSSNVTYMIAYGDYAHAVKTISAGASDGFWVDQGGIDLVDSIEDYYDTINSANATWSGSW